MLRPGTLHKIIPQGQIGNARVIHDAPDLLTRARAARDGQPLSAEKYTRLIADGTLWMTDAEFECWTNYDFVSSAYGDIMIAGLGLGLILRPLLDSEDVTSVTVLEINPDIISLIAPHYKNRKLKVVEADVKAWTAPKRAFDRVYFDIWPNVPIEDQKAEISALKKRYRTSLKSGGRTSAWCERMIGRKY